MPIEFKTCLDKDLLYARWWGYIDDTMRHANFANYLNDKHYRPNRPELIDVSGISDTDWTFEQAQINIQRVNAQKPGGAIHTYTVIWAPSDYAFGCARMYQTLAEFAGGIVVEIYREEGQALAAHNLPYRSMTELLAHETFLPHEPRSKQGLEAKTHTG